MHFSIDDRIFQQFPGTMVGIVVAHGITNTQHRQEIDDLAQQIRENLIRMGSTIDLTQHPHISSWRQAYKAFGAIPKNIFLPLKIYYSILLNSNRLRP